MKRGWTHANGVWIRWHLESPANRRSLCEGTRHEGDRWVEKDEPRLEVDNEMGKSRARSKGKKNQWVCQGCALASGAPPIPFDNQERLFE